MMSDSNRLTTIEHFLRDAGWGKAQFSWLAQDASTRRYARLKKPDGSTAILMDAPPLESLPCTPTMSDAERTKLGWNALTRLAASRVEAFAAVAEHLRKHGFSAPKVLAGDASSGLAVIEDFGNGLELARLIEGGADETTLYVAAAETLAAVHAVEIPDTLTGLGRKWPILQFDRLALQTNADLFAEWLPKYDQRMSLSDADLVVWERERDALLDMAEAFPRRFTLRDYHAENLLWLGDRAGKARIGLLDFQDAVIGWDAWDMAMLVQDARREVSPEARQAAIAAYLDKTGTNESEFLERLSIIGTLNALRITGLFARLIQRDGKPRYKPFFRRQKALLAANLAHPSAAGMQAFIRNRAPFILEGVA